MQGEGISTYDEAKKAFFDLTEIDLAKLLTISKRYWFGYLNDSIKQSVSPEDIWTAPLKLERF